MAKIPQLAPQSIQCIGFIGVGVMGEPMCRHLATKSKLEVLAYDLDQDPLERLAAFGVKAASMAQISQQAIRRRHSISGKQPGTIKGAYL